MGFLELLISLRNPFICLSFLLSVPSIVLYSAEIATIVRHQKFHNSFYLLFVFRAIPDLVYVLDSYYCYRLTIVFGWLLLPVYSTLPNWMLALAFFLTGFTFQAANLATGFMLFNRFTAIALPLRHEKIWAKYLVLAGLCIFGVPLFACLSMFEMHAVNQPDAANSTSFFLYGAPNDPYVAHLDYMDMVVSILFLVVCVAINLGTLVVYRKRNSAVSTMQSANNSNSTRIERKLLVYALVTFLGHVLVAVLLISVYYCSNVAQNLTMVGAIYTQYPWMMDAGTLALSSWLLLWASDSFREQLLKDFAPKLLAERWGQACLPQNQVIRVQPPKQTSSHLPRTD